MQRQTKRDPASAKADDQAKKNAAVNVKEGLRELQKESGGDQQCIDFNYMVFTYGKFHNNFVNQFIHVVFVPIISYTFYAQFAAVLPFYELPYTIPLLGSTFSLAIMPYIMLALAYFIVDVPTAAVHMAWSATVVVFAHNEWVSHRTESYFGFSQLAFMMMVNAASWIAQFIGHGCFEQRAPAIGTNLTFALLAPFFITFETMNRGFGYRTGPKMNRLRYLIDMEIEEYHAARSSKAN